MTYISCHVLDTSLGKPAAEVVVSLHKVVADTLHMPQIASQRTNTDGRVNSFMTEPLSSGTYRLMFNITDYFATRQQECFYPAISIDFFVDEASEHYHIPLLVSPYGYTTYRGS